MRKAEQRLTELPDWQRKGEEGESAGYDTEVVESKARPTNTRERKV